MTRFLVILMTITVTKSTSWMMVFYMRYATTEIYHTTEQSRPHHFDRPVVLIEPGVGVVELSPQCTCATKIEIAKVRSTTLPRYVVYIA